tara:strand:- start:42 stop:755 length:714 start_codon:yes stop_codon:yes gene_type:complete
MSTRKTTLFDAKLTPVITESPDSVSIGTSNSGSTSSPSLSSDSSYNIKDSITNLFSSSYTIYILIFLILAVLGINIFAYLGYLTEDTIGILRPLIFVGISTTSDISQDIISNSAEGTKAATDIVAGTVNSAIDTTGNVLTQSSNDDELEEETVDDHDKLQKDINEDNKRSNDVPEPDDATSKTQKVKGKSGFCYIGEDRGFRSCIEVNENDTCMSGDIFPTEQICINPSLREGTEKY